MNILRKFAVFAAFAAVTTVFVGCSDQDQSSLSIEDFQSKAIVKGKICYFNEDKYTIEGTGVLLPAANKQIYAELDNASLSGKNSNQGVTVIETMTDANGNYVFEIPVLNDGMTISLRPQPFEGSYKFLRDWGVGKEPILEILEGLFECEEKEMEVMPNDIKFQDFKYEFSERDVIKEDNDVDLPISLTVTVKLGVFNKNNFKAELKPAFDFEVRIRSYSSSVNFMKLTNSQGEVTFDFYPSETSDDIVYLSVTSSSMKEFDYPYISNQNDEEDEYDWKKIYGSYQQWNSQGFYNSVTIPIVFDGIDIAEKVMMVFKPHYSSSVDYNYYSEWSDVYSDWMNSNFK